MGASRGIGLGFVKQFLQRHEAKEEGITLERIYATYRREESAGELLTLTEQNKELLFPLSMDVTDESSISKAIKSISDRTKKLHLVIYCVGVLHDRAAPRQEGDRNFQPEKSLRQIVPENLIYYFQVNSIGAVLLAKHLMPLLRHSDNSLLAAISAKVGSIGDNRLGGWYGYRASKAALNMFLKTISLEYKRRCPKTIVVALHPGTTDTDLSEPFQANVPPGKLFPVTKTVSQLLEVMSGLKPQDSGEFFSWDGSSLPW